MSRTIAIGDIHGCSVALNALLEQIQIQPDDTIVGLGDYVDRGLDSAGVLECLVGLVGHCQLVPLIGNHELMMFQALRNPNEYDFWMQHGGNATIASYGGSAQNIPVHHMTFLSHCVRFYETETHFFVHANYLPDVPLSEQPDQLLFWTHILENPPLLHCSGKTAIVGHTPQVEGAIRDLGHVKILDTYCYGDSWLTALDVDSGQLWQANNLGEVRTENIS